MFYYAGHVVQSDGENYIVPVDLNNLSRSSIENRSVKMDRIIRSMEVARNSIKIIILDACTTNLSKSSSGTINQGLAKILPSVPSVRDLYISMSTFPGRFTPIEACRSSPYTNILSRNLIKDGLSISEIFQNTRNEVKNVTGGQQTPWYYYDETTNFYFTKRANKPSPTPETPRLPEPPTNDDTDKDQKLYSAEEYINIARSYMKINDLNKALATYKNLIDKFPHNPLAIDSKFEVAQIYKSTNRWDEALIVYSDLSKSAEKSSHKKKVIKNVDKLYNHYCTVFDGDKAKKSYDMLCKLSELKCLALVLKTVSCDAGILKYELEQKARKLEEMTKDIPGLN